MTEVRLIDPKTDNDQNAGRVQGTVIRVIHPKHHPAPSPYRFLVKRAFEPEIHHAGKSGKTDFLKSRQFHPDPSTQSIQNAGEAVHRQTSHRLSVVAETVLDGPPATYQPYFVTKDDSGKEVWWSPETKTFESRKVGAGNADRSAVICRFDADKVKNLKEGNSQFQRTNYPEDRVGPALDSHHKAEMARTDSRGSPRECQSAPSYPAPSYCINNGSPVSVDVDQNAVAGRLFLLRKTNCGIDSSSCSSQNFPPPASAPKSKQNAGGPEKFVPPGMESQSPCSRSSKPMEVIGGSHKFFSPFGRFLDKVLEHSLSRVLDKILPHSAFNDPTMERVNGVWRKRA